MKQQSTKEIIKYLRDNIEPLKDDAYGDGYRAAAYLTDGTYLPCVIFRNPKTLVKLAIKRFKDERKGLFKLSSGISYYNIVKSFVTNGNCINSYDIATIERSKFAFPLKIQQQIRGETSMGWTGFAAKMKDGEYLGFGTSFHWEFFEMPQNYLADDIVEIVNHSYVLKNGELRYYKVPSSSNRDDYKDAIIYREKPFFECYLEEL